MFWGDAERQRPAVGGTSSPDDWFYYVYYRDNKEGSHVEYWQHTRGCRAWLLVSRDSATQTVAKVALAREQKS